jgi:hypothetical protein
MCPVVNFISGFEKSICPNCGLPLKRILHIFHSIEKGEQVQLDKQPTRQTVNETELHDLFVQESEKPETKDTKPLSKELKLVLGIIISISSIGLLTPLLVEEFGLPIVRMAILEITFLVCLMVSIWAWLIKNNRVRYTSTRKKGIKIALFLITGFCVGVPIFNIIRVLVLTAINVGNWEDPSLAGGVVVGGLPIPLSGASINFLLLGGMYVFLISIIFGLVSLLIKTYQTIIKDF